MDQGNQTTKENFAEPTKYDSIFWVEVERIQPNPYQPRREFDEERLKSLAESIRQYGVLQPLVVTRSDVEREDGGLSSMYELIAGERRLRASKLIGLREVPVVIRVGEQTDHMKLELAIIENLQREDLNAIDRAKALAQLVEEFGLKHGEVAAKVGRSREFVTNCIRLLMLPEEIQNAVVGREISEGHARALLMLSNRPEEQNTVFKDIVMRKTSVRVTEQLVRRIAQDKIRVHNKTPEMMELEKSLTETLGTRVVIENRPKGGRLLIEFFSPEDLTHIAKVLNYHDDVPGELEVDESPSELPTETLPEEIHQNDEVSEIESLEVINTSQIVVSDENTSPIIVEESSNVSEVVVQEVVPTPPEEDLYSVTNFTV